MRLGGILTLLFAAWWDTSPSLIITRYPDGAVAVRVYELNVLFSYFSLFYLVYEHNIIYTA